MALEWTDSRTIRIATAMNLIQSEGAVLCCCHYLNSKSAVKLVEMVIRGDAFTYEKK